MPDKNTTNIHGDLNVTGDFVAGDKHVTIIQKFFNIFKSDSETLEQRNRRILLGHVENAWIKGVLDASLHGAALLDLGIKQDPEAVTQYPWAIQKESTKETLPAGTSMLEIFDSIGFGRSLLILGAPGSGKTTMLLELARQLIARAREDITNPIPMVFNLASWTEKLSLADWLAQELNNLYSVPRKTAPDWVKGNKLLLLLDGLDEVRLESRAKCVEAINEFRKQNGLTSLAVCSRSQDYADLNAKLSFEGAIEVQPLTQEKITEFFNRFGDEMAGIKQALEKDSALSEMAETPLFLSIILMAYQDKQDVEFFVSGDERESRKHLFGTYIERMIEWRSKNARFNKQEVLHWVSWVAGKLIKHNQTTFLLEKIQPTWLDVNKNTTWYLYESKIIGGLIAGLAFGLPIGLVNGIFHGTRQELVINLIIGIIYGLLLSLIAGMIIWVISEFESESIKDWKEISTIDYLSWSWKGAMEGLFFGLIIGIVLEIILKIFGPIVGLTTIRIPIGFYSGILFSLMAIPMSGLSIIRLDESLYPNFRLILTIKNLLFVTILVGFFSGIIIWIIVGFYIGSIRGLFYGLFGGLVFGLFMGFEYGGQILIRHYTLRYILARDNLLPWRLIPFLDHCVDLIFLRRVGGGYIFIHRLLMEHFAEMYVETTK